jgi:hypothetical protein
MVVSIICVLLGYAGQTREVLGENIMFTPIDIDQNWIFNQRLCIVMFVIRGNQYVNPAKMVNTAFIEST